MFLYCLSLLTLILLSSHFFFLLFSSLIYFSLLRDEQQHKDQENLLDIHDQADTDAPTTAAAV